MNKESPTESETKTEKPVKVFISYSHSSEKHKNSVIELATRLRGDGVDAVLDAWDLKPGNNLHKFMESMVTSSEISKVLLIVDKEYKRKADEGTGGVGKETEIVSSQIYNKANQEKFIPVVWERGEAGEDYLPAFLAPRVYVDMSGIGGKDPYQELIRVILDKPQFVKPALGKTPAFLNSETSTPIPRSFLGIKERISNASSSTSSFFDDLNQSIKDLVITENTRPPTDEEVLSRIQSFQPILTECLPILSQLMATDGKAIIKPLQSFFEECLKNYSGNASATGGSWYPNQFSAAQFVSQELLLHCVALFLKHELFSELDSFIDLGLVHTRHHNKALGSVFDLYEHIEILDVTRNQRLNLRRMSITADLLKERSEAAKVAFDELMAADVILYIRAEFTGQHWFPRTTVYFGRTGRLEIFLRAEVAIFFSKFCQVLKVKNLSDLKAKWEERKDNFDRLRIGMWHALNLKEACNIDRLATR